MSMTVEKSTADDVRKKFETLQKDKDQPVPVDSVMDGRHWLLCLPTHIYESAQIGKIATVP